MKFFAAALACLAGVATVTAHTITVCYSASASSPGKLQLWFVSYHSISETPMATIRVTLPDTTYTDYMVTDTSQLCSATVSNTGASDVDSVQSDLQTCAVAEPGMQLACVRADGSSVSGSTVARDPGCVYTGTTAIAGVVNVTIPSVSGWTVSILNTNDVLTPYHNSCAPGAGATVSISSPNVVAALPTAQIGSGSGSGSGEAKIDYTGTTGESAATSTSGKKGKKGKKGKTGKVGSSATMGKSSNGLSASASALGAPANSAAMVIGVAALVAGVVAVVHRRNRMHTGFAQIPLTEQLPVMADEHTPLVVVKDEAAILMA